MKVTVVGAIDRRNRERFLVEPLTKSGHSVKMLGLKLTRDTLCEIFHWFSKSKRPDVILLVGVGLSTMMVFLFSRLSGVPVILRLGGHPIEDKRNFLEKSARIGVLTRAKYVANLTAAKFLIVIPRYVICVNEYLAQRIKPVLREDATVYIVHQFCDGPETIRKTKTNAKIECLTVANLNFVPKAEGIVWIVRQLDQYCRKSGRTVRYNIAGDGAAAHIIKDFLSKSDLCSNLEVELLGFVDDVNSLYSKADFFLYRSDHDGTPNVLLEAKRWGIPTFINDYSAFRSLISNNVTGFIFSSESEFLRKFKDVVEDPKLQKRVSLAAKQDHELRFSRSAVALDLENTLQKICESYAHR